MPPGNPFASAGLKGVASPTENLADCCAPKVERGPAAQSAGAASATSEKASPKIVVEVVDKPMDGFSMGSGAGFAASSSASTRSESVSSSANQGGAYNGSSQQASAHVGQQASPGSTAEGGSSTTASSQKAQAESAKSNPKRDASHPTAGERQQEREVGERVAARSVDSIASNRGSSDQTASYQESPVRQVGGGLSRGSPDVQEKSEKVVLASPERSLSQESAKDRSTHASAITSSTGIVEIKSLNVEAAKISVIVAEARQIAGAVVAIGGAGQGFRTNNDLAIIARVFESAATNWAMRSNVQSNPVVPNYRPSSSSPVNFSARSEPAVQRTFSVPASFPRNSQAHVGTATNINANGRIYLRSVSSNPAAAAVGIATAHRLPGTQKHFHTRTVRLTALESRLVSLAPRMGISTIRSAIDRMASMIASLRSNRVEGPLVALHKQLRLLGLSASGAKVLGKLLDRVATMSSKVNVRSTVSNTRMRPSSRRLSPSRTIARIKARSISRSVGSRMARAHLRGKKAVIGRHLHRPLHREAYRRLKSMAPTQRAKLLQVLCKAVIGAKEARPTKVALLSTRSKLIAILNILRAQRQISNVLYGSLINALGGGIAPAKRRGLKDKHRREGASGLRLDEQAACDQTLEVLLEVAFTELDSGPDSSDGQQAQGEDGPEAPQQQFYATNSEGPKWELDIEQHKAEDAKDKLPDSSVLS